MKIKLHPRIRNAFSKHFQQRLPKLILSVAVTFKDFKGYWNKCPYQLKKNSLCFFSKDLIDFVNNTNNRLLYKDLMSKKQSLEAWTQDEREFALLNAFEMLWNIEGEEERAKAKLSHDKKEDNLDLVQIMSHTKEGNEGSDEKQAFSPNKVQGHALTIKDEFLNTFLDICQRTSPGFLETSQDSLVSSSEMCGKEKILITDEELLIRAIESKKIETWEEFESILLLVLENRVLQIYQTHLDSEYQRKWKKLDQELIAFKLHGDTPPKNKKKRNKKKHKKDKPCLVGEGPHQTKDKEERDSEEEKHLSVGEASKQKPEESFGQLIGIGKTMCEYRKQDFVLDFSSVYSGGSTTDNINSDEDPKKVRTRGRSRPQPDFVHHKSRQSSGKFYCYMPELADAREYDRMFGEVDEVSSESSLDQSEDRDTFEQYLQECYYQNYCIFESQAKARNYVVDVYNYNSNHPWQNQYIENQKYEELMESINLSAQSFWNYQSYL